MFDPLVPVLVFLVTAGVKEFLLNVFHKDLNAATSALIASVITAFVVWANEFAAMIPAQFVPVIAALVATLVAIASAFGVHSTVKMLARK